LSSTNRSTANEQSRIFKRKALRPLLNLFEYNLTTKLVWELDPAKEVEFKYDDYDIEQDFRKAELNEKLKQTWTINEIRKKDNMAELEGEEYDKIAGAGGMQQGFGNSFGQNDFTGQDKIDNQANKDDMSNNERSPEKEDKLFERPESPSTKTIDNVPKITDSEKLLKKMYDNLEKTILNALD